MNEYEQQFKLKQYVYKL